MVTFHIILNCFLILSALLVFLAENTVHSILFLVLTFLNAAAICFIFCADFLGLLLIIIYVGAIAVLFLFVIMMLNVKMQVLGVLRFMPLIIIVCVIIFTELYITTAGCYSNFNYLEPSFLYFESLTKDSFLSQTLYNYFLVCFLISGIILLVGMVGAIILTLNFRTKKCNEVSYRQLSRSDKMLSFFK